MSLPLPAQPARAGLAASCEHEFRADISATGRDLEDATPSVAVPSSDSALRYVLFAALWILILVAAGVGGYKRVELDARTDGIEMSR